MFYFDYLQDFYPPPETPTPQGYTLPSAQESEFAKFPDCLMGRVMIEDNPGWNTSGAPVRFNSHVTFAGRRNRVLAAFCRYLYRSPAHHAHWFTSSGASEPRNKPVFVMDHRMTFREAFGELMGDSEPAEQARHWLSDQRLRKSGIEQMHREIPAEQPNHRASTMHSYLNDLALMVRRDLVEAIDAYHNGGYYPGVDAGIDPVPDSHVELVIWGAQRELDKETRVGSDGTTRLPAYPLASLPFGIQRAFAERRRLRFAEWGVTRQGWADNHWSVFDIPDDLWVPPWNESSDVGA